MASECQHTGSQSKKFQSPASPGLQETHVIVLHIYVHTDRPTSQRRIRQQAFDVRQPPSSQLLPYHKQPSVAQLKDGQHVDGKEDP